MTKAKKINVFSFVKFQLVLGVLIGLLAGIVYSFGGLIIDTLVSMQVISSNETQGLSFGTMLAFGALIGMPIIFAGFGLVLGLFEAILFNLCAKWLPSVNINFEL